MLYGTSPTEASFDCFKITLLSRVCGGGASLPSSLLKNCLWPTIPIR